MKKFTQKVKARGWKLKAVAERWGFSIRRLQQIADDPGQLHEDAVTGLPSTVPGADNFDDFDEVVASGSSFNVAMLILVATKKHGWTDEQTRQLAGQILDLIDYSEQVREHNLKKREYSQYLYFCKKERGVKPKLCRDCMKIWQQCPIVGDVTEYATTCIYKKVKDDEKTNVRGNPQVQKNGDKKRLGT